MRKGHLTKVPICWPSSEAVASAENLSPPWENLRTEERQPDRGLSKDAVGTFLPQWPKTFATFARSPFRLRFHSEAASRDQQPGKGNLLGEAGSPSREGWNPNTRLSTQSLPQTGRRRKFGWLKMWQGEVPGSATSCLGERQPQTLGESCLGGKGELAQ